MHSSSPPIWAFLFFFSIFSFPSLSLPFSPANNVTLLGDAHFKNNTISLTRDLNCPYPPPPPTLPDSQPPPPPHYLGVGRALYIYPIRFLDSATNTTASFSCRFTFSMTPVSPLCPHGDGIAFLIISNSSTFSRSNGYMGLPDSSSFSKTQDSFVAVEFDTSFDPGLGDINGNHIGIDVNSVISFASVDAVSKGIDLRGGKELNAWIEYRDSVKMIRVWVGYSPIRPASPVLVAQIDLSKQFKEFMHVGFSAANGQGSAIHIVRKWHFKTFGYLPLASSMDTVEEGDCLMCSPDDPTTINDGVLISHKKKSKIGQLALGFGGLAALVVAVIAVLAITIFYIKRKKRFNGRISGELCTVQTNRGPTRLSLAEIKSATLGFNQSRVVGEGASSIVYEGHLPSGGTVAVKRFSQINRIDCFSHSFTTEFATMASCLNHRNLVQLQGWCCEGNELVLVYEYLPNGSLEKLLHKNTRSPSFLTWEIRVNIVLGIASALTYLHEECERQIIHRDVKSCNIMLDENFTAKLGDFGLAQVYERSCLTREATIPAGTMGYLAPEYVYSGVPTEKTDVYSFGVVVLELATGRKPVDDYGIVLVDWVWDLWEKGKVIEAVDSRLMGRYRRAEMERMLMVGLSCVHPNYEKRPTVKEAAKVLRGELALPVLPARKPMVRIRSVMSEDPEEMLISCGNGSPGLDEAAWLTPRSHFS